MKRKNIAAVLIAILGCAAILSACSSGSATSTTAANEAIAADETDAEDEPVMEDETAVNESNENAEVITADGFYENTEEIPFYEPLEGLIDIDWSDRLVETPELIIPDNLDEWKIQREEIRDMIIDTLGNVPPRPDTVDCETYQTGSTPLFTFERFYLNNGYGDIVPGTIYIPEDLTEKAPAILYLHYHGGEYDMGQNELLHSWPLAESGQPMIDEFIKRGYIVMSIDAYAFGTRSGSGPGYDPFLSGDKETAQDEESSLYKYLTVQGIANMGMIVRDDRIALDDRVKVTVSVACLTRMQDFIKTGNINWHAFFNWVPGMLAKFDTESVVSLIAPRYYMQLMGTEDIGSPIEGVRYIDEKMQEVYKLYDASDHLEFHYYEGLGHAYLPEEFELMLDYFDEHL